MSAAWDVIRRALSDATTDLFTVLASNLFWLVGNALVITGPPATLALFYVANRLARGEVTDPGDFIAAFRRYFKPAWRWGLLNLLVVFFLVGDVVITGRLLEPRAARLIQGFYIQALLFWLFLQLDLLPFLEVGGDEIAGYARTHLDPPGRLEAADELVPIDDGLDQRRRGGDLRQCRSLRRRRVLAAAEHGGCSQRQKEAERTHASISLLRNEKRDPRRPPESRVNRW